MIEFNQNTTISAPQRFNDSPEWYEGQFMFVVPFTSFNKTLFRFTNGDIPEDLERFSQLLSSLKEYDILSYNSVILDHIIDSVLPTKLTNLHSISGTRINNLVNEFLCNSLCKSISSTIHKFSSSTQGI
mmetsp:Transcript_10441/g.9222  ORF Transcript_10441/g.9222 Transcript_10441/m.9222 type:complete len:129 (+) Transcript_10441:1243-1629(+)